LHCPPANIQIQGGTMMGLNNGNVGRSREISKEQLCSFLQSMGKKFHEMHGYFTIDVMKQNQ
jgi:hypothetical protein